jgi:hypothetical protein
MSSAFPDFLLKIVSLGTEGKVKLGRWDKELIIMASNFHEIPKHVAVFLVSWYYTMVSNIIANSDGCGLIPRPEDRLLGYVHFPESVQVNAGIVLKVALGRFCFHSSPLSES